jgi:hypothetical protein
MERTAPALNKAAKVEGSSDMQMVPDCWLEDPE